jgi:hypothetical protein
VRRRNDGIVVELLLIATLKAAFKREAFSLFRGKRQADFGDFSDNV